jgi:ferredoxin
MDTATSFQDQLLFHITGRRDDVGFAAEVDVATLRPALMAPYRSLERLRHDYPLVLVDQAVAGAGAGFVCPLASVVSRLAADLAPRGIEGERLRRHLLRLEAALRAMVSEGRAGRLTELWPLALESALGRAAKGSTPSAAGAAPLDARVGDEMADAAAERVLAQAAQSLPVDGELVPCDERLPARLLRHAWQQAQQAKAREFHATAERLMRGLSDVLRAAWAHSRDGQQPQALREAVGAAHAEVFDFELMSRLVARRAPADELPPARRRRIEWALAVLKAQRLWPDERLGQAPHDGWVFEDCAGAMAAFQQHLPQAVDLLKAVAIAELEVRGAYVEAEHDPVFEAFGAASLTADDFATLPASLVCIPPEQNAAPQNAALLDMLSSGLPVKVLVQVSDLLEESALGTGHFAFGVKSARLATTAMGLGGLFVMQAAVCALPALAADVARGMARRTPALFVVHAGSAQAAADLPRYLSAAAAHEARAFPAFTYDAAAGPNWATRFSLAGNRDAEADWPRQTFEYADESLQRVSEALDFTYADFALTDRRHAAHFAPVPRERWHAGMLPVAQWLDLPEAQAARCVPYVLAVDGADRLWRLLVDARLMKAVQACRLLWHRLQEHAGIHDSHAERLLAEERARQAAVGRSAAPDAAGAPAPTSAAGAAGPVAAASSDAPAVAENPAPPSDEAWIETARCPSCNECQLINPRLFGYNDNKQAFIKDINAGSYRDLVEAAESCQVAIIHPGKPRHPDEPGLAELIERARPFL